MALLLLIPATAASAAHHRGSAGFWAAERAGGKESLGFALRRHGRRIRHFDGGLSPVVRDACYGRLNFGRIRVSRRGRFKDRFTTDHGSQTARIRGHFKGRRRAVFFVRRIETPPGLPPCDSGPVRFVAKFVG